MHSYIIGEIVIFLSMFLSQATNRDTYYNLKQSFAETKNEEVITPSYLSCASVCGSVNECCGLNFDTDTKICVLLKHCSYGTATPRELSYFKNARSGVSCSEENIALNKPCGQSSVKSNSPTYACDKANDGSLTEYMHTAEGAGWNGTFSLGESYPYWLVDMLSLRSVKKVVIHNRQDNEVYARLHNVNVTVGDYLANLYQCGYHDGPVPNMDPLTITCTRDVEGRYVQIMNMDASVVENFLHVTEVEVYDCWP